MQKCKWTFRNNMSTKIPKNEKYELFFLKQESKRIKKKHREEL